MRFLLLLWSMLSLSVSANNANDVLANPFGKMEHSVWSVIAPYLLVAAIVVLVAFLLFVFLRKK